jgi:hypothetical protein
MHRCHVFVEICFFLHEILQNGGTLVFLKRLIIIVYFIVLLCFRRDLFFLHEILQNGGTLVFLKRLIIIVYFIIFIFLLFMLFLC